jgi:hypothetical protein
LQKKRSRDHSLLFLFAFSHIVTQLAGEYNTFIAGCKRNFCRRIGRGFAEKPCSVAIGGSAIGCPSKK